MSTKFLTTKEAMEEYKMCRNTLNKVAIEAGARVSVGSRKKLINTTKLDAYLESQAEGQTEGGEDR